MEMVNTEESEPTCKYRVEQFKSEEGCYGVRLMQNQENGIEKVRDWVFGSKPIDEVISFYWFQTASRMIEHYKECRTDFENLLFKNSDAREIKMMCKKAVEFSTL